MRTTLENLYSQNAYQQIAFDNRHLSSTKTREIPAGWAKGFLPGKCLINL